MTPLQRHKLVYVLLRPVCLFMKLRFHFQWDDLSQIDGPYLLLPNHNMELDPALVGAATKKQLYFVASEHLTRKGWISKLLMYVFEPIIHQKGRMGIHTVKAILKHLRAGNSVCLFPEGNRSFNGLTCPIPPATGKLARRCGVKVITYRFEGHYLTQPRWSLTCRRGRLVGRLVHVYTPEELQAMTDQEVNDAIARDLFEDAYARQEQEKVAFKGRKLALGMESTLFGCPQCGKIGHMHSDNDSIHCDCCGYRAKYDVYGYLTDQQGQVSTIAQLDALQHQRLRTLADSSEYLLFSDPVSFQEISEDHQLIREIHGTLEAYRDRLIFGDVSVPFAEMLGMSIYSRNFLVFHTTAHHYEVRGDQMFSALKYLYLFEHAKEEP